MYVLVGLLGCFDIKTYWLSEPHRKSDYEMPWQNAKSTIISINTVLIHPVQGPLAGPRPPARPAAGPGIRTKSTAALPWSIAGLEPPESPPAPPAPQTVLLLERMAPPFAPAPC